MCIGWTHDFHRLAGSARATVNAVLDVLTDFKARTHDSVIKSGMVCRYLKVKLPFKTEAYGIAFLL